MKLILGIVFFPVIIIFYMFKLIFALLVVLGRMLLAFDLLKWASKK